MSDEKIIEILKTKGTIDATKYVKSTYSVSLKEAKEVVDDVIAKNPGITPAKETTSTAQALLSIGILVLIIWGGCKMCGGDDTPPIQTLGQSKYDTSDFKMGAYFAAKIYMQNNLKSPATAEFPELDFENHTRLYGDSTFEVLSYVDSQNSFGATVRTNFLAQFKWLGGDIDSLKNWKKINLEIVN